MDETQRCITLFADRLLKGDERPFNTFVATIRIEKETPSEDFIPDTFYHMIFYTNSNYVTVMGVESESMNPDLSDKFTMQARHDSCWRSDGFIEINKIARDVHRVYLNDVDFMNLENNLDYELGSDEWNSTFTFNRFEKTIKRE